MPAAGPSPISGRLSAATFDEIGSTSTFHAAHTSRAEASYPSPAAAASSEIVKPCSGVPTSSVVRIPPEGSASRAPHAGRRPRPEAQPEPGAPGRSTDASPHARGPVAQPARNHSPTAGRATTAGCDISHERNRRGVLLRGALGRQIAKRPSADPFVFRPGIDPARPQRRFELRQRDTQGRAGRTACVER